MHGLRQRLDLRCLALLALAIQFVAAFGHVHLASAKVHPFARTCTSASAVKSALPCIPRHHADHDCPICLAQANKAAGLPPAAPEVAPRLLIASATYARPDTVDARRAAPRGFQARAPPEAA